MKKALHSTAIFLLMMVSSSLHAQERDTRNQQYSTPQEKAFYHTLHTLAQQHTPRSLGNWRIIKEMDDPSVMLILLGHPVHKGIYASDYSVVYHDVPAAVMNAGVDSIYKTMKDREFQAVSDSVESFMSKHTCAINIYFNTTQVPLHFMAGSIKTEQPAGPFTYRIISNNEGKQRPVGRQAMVAGLGPHQKPAVYYHDPSGSSKNGYALAPSLRNEKLHAFSIQTVDILITARHEVAAQFLEAMQLDELRNKLGQILVEIK